MPSLALPSYKRQQLLLEFAAIRSKCPEGIYLAPEAANPAIWSGIFFAREGPYASAILRFEIVFPPAYPDIGPSINFSTEIFHPLLVPLTTYTFGAGALDPNATLNSSEADRLKPGSFNLREAFPTWYTGSSNDARSARSSSIGSGSFDEVAPTQDQGVPAQAGAQEDGLKKEKRTLPAVMQYLKRAFEDASFLDNLSPRAAVNTNAWHAWRAHRGLPKLGSRSISPASAESGRTPLSPRLDPGDWNWDGVWESRVKNGIEESMSDAVLFGSKNNRPAASMSGPIKFAKNDDDKIQDIQDAMLRALGMEATT
ncbi:hypothetical protein PMZ80_008847 [Knufia obscura]|uniref:UBC core domain-containing protein n=2 Tax=Knufia TaxID=430999 RepID=A0AAN8EN96_9EURO|nr:hypothetical protein PMZ80_008847 [Knufia obscura]KAK5955193.1 hypothetical protein OHC33_003873 [Knufia fluminis]